MVNNNQWTYGILRPDQLQSADGAASVLFVHLNDFYIFDPHSRYANGKPTPDGISVLLNFKKAEECCIYIKQLAFFMYCNQYDLTKIKVTNLFNDPK